jgi:ketosteroid isomerase-like protein
MVTALFIVLILSVSSRYTSVHAQRSQDEAEIAALIDRWADARVKGDAAFLEHFYAAELRIGLMNGEFIERKDDIALFAERRVRPEYIRDSDLSIAVYHDMAVVSCVETLKGTYNGRAGEMSLRMLNVLLHRAGRWQLVASQSVRISTPPAIR